MPKDAWKNIKNILAKVAPIVGNALLPGVGGLAGSLLAETLGVEDNPGSIESALVNAQPAQIAKIKEMQMTHRERLIELGTINDKLYIQDIQNARQREIDIVKTTGKKDYNLYFLACSVVIGFFVLVGMLMNYTLPDKNIGPVNQLFGALSAGFGVVLAYFFGSSKSSSDKTELMINKKQGGTG